ncbi:TGACG-sequence-specific DNA-binding protein TGA-2.1 [Dichanthelium oligosanthes]|uniref:TGACG-sequence-specific DNA-binding protein TGA-2.1 n=1 Tax=Dichanthelium oligosanthes TaxID=888268 RepID=A0A1E5W0M4_9POAL|nr:TGACG-sequence-specific DNA-binding protein TGA-2.1 [Dichanthelium oligosanthes]
MAYPSTSGMVQTSSSLRGSIRRDPEGYDMPSDLDQALLLYFDGQQAKPSIQEQQPQTLNIFPSQPMHHIDPSPKGSMASSAAAAAQVVAGPSKNPQAPSSKPGGGPLAVGKSSKTAMIKREGSAGGGKHGGAGASSSDQEGPRTPDPKTLRRLAQNREAARKSRLRKKAYIQQLESGRIRLAHLEQEMQMSRTHQGALWGAGTLSPDAALFNLEYERWLGDNSKVVSRLRAAAEEHRPDGELRAYADEAASHYGALMGHKARLAAADPLHLLSGLWKGAAERCFLWIGGFRPSELIKLANTEQVAVRHVEPLVEQQAAGARDVEQAARRAEEALDAELEALLRSLSEVVSSDAQQPPPGVFGGQLYQHHPGADAAAGYMGMGHMHMALAMDKLATLGNFLRQADELRMQALHALRQILTARQAARCFIAVDDYFCRLRALSTLWTTSRTVPQLARGPAG